MAKERVVSSYIDNKFLNVPSNSIFSYGSFNITSNFDNKISKDFSNKLTSFSTPITLETIGLDSTQSNVLNIKTNSIILNLDRTDLNTFVRFGSAYEFLRISLENIILKYPGSLYFNSERNTQSTVLNYLYDQYNNISTIYLAADKIVNNFELVYDSTNLTYEIGKEIKNLNNSFSNYTLWFPISADTSYNIIGFTGITNTQNWIIINVVGEVFPNGISTKLDLHIKPNGGIFEQFMILLSDYERYILSQRNTITDFSFKLKDPTLQEDGNIIYIDTNLKWNTKDGYNIDINTIHFQKMFDIILTIGNKFDTIKTDLIARFLSPTSLKTYDLTDNGKVSKLLRVYGYEFDKLREFIDSMVNINKLSYNKINNVPDQLVGNLAKVLGWNYSSIVDSDQFISGLFTIDNDHRNQNELIPSEIDIELWRRILINTNFFWKSKGTRESIKAILLLIGIPEQFINITEYIYTVDGKINPTESLLVPIDFPTNSLPYDTLGYPKAPIDQSNFYFQISGDTDSGQAYMNIFRTAGFDLSLVIDNRKSWIQEGEIVRLNNNAPSYYQEDSRLVLNTKEIDLALDTAQFIDNSIYENLISNPSGFTDYYGVGSITGMTYLDFIDTLQKRLINAKNRKTISDFKGGWYPALYNIYAQYLGSTSGYTYDIVYAFISKYSAIFEDFINQIIPSTVIIRNGGFLISNSIFNKQKFMYRRGTYMGIINTYGELSNKTTFDYDPNIQYLGDDGAIDIRLQYQYSAIFNPSLSVCQISGNTRTGNKLYYDLLVTKLLDNIVQSVVGFNLLSAFTVTGATYSAITTAQLTLYTNAMYSDRYAGLVKYIGDTYYSGLEYFELPIGNISSGCTVTTTTTTVPVTTTTTTNNITTTTTTVPVTTTTTTVPVTTTTTTQTPIAFGFNSIGNLNFADLGSETVSFTLTATAFAAQHWINCYPESIGSADFSYTINSTTISKLVTESSASVINKDPSNFLTDTIIVNNYGNSIIQSAIFAVSGYQTGVACGDSEGYVTLLISGFSSSNPNIILGTSFVTISV